MSFYGKAYRRLIWPTYEALRGHKTPRLLAAAEARQWWPAEQLREFQWQELLKLLRHAHDHCPWYRERWQTMGIDFQEIQTLTDFHKLPVVTKDDIYQHRNTMRASDVTDRVFEHRTGGSTGQPLRFYINRASYDWRLAVSLRGYTWAGCHDGDRQFYLWGQPIGTPPFSKRLKTKAHNAVLRRRVVSSFQLNESKLADCLRQIKAFRPKTIVGYTNALYLLAQHTLNTQPLHHRPSAVITAAEGVNAIQRELIERAFRTPVFASYGSREFMLIAMECDQHRGLHLSADNLLVEVVRPDGSPAATGEVGEILVTDLHNYAMPFIRYKIGDLGVLSNRTCPCGRGLPLLERVEGRVLDVIRTPDGRIVPGEFFPHLMKEFAVVRQFQIVQRALDRLEIKLVLHAPSAPVELARLEQEIRQIMGPSIQLEFQLLMEIPQTASGKFRVTISQL